jgi:hypothetical protein
MKKWIYILVGILAIFVIIYLSLLRREKGTFSVGVTENFLQLDSASVDRIEFRRFGSRMVLEEEGPQWYVVEPDSYRANNDAVGRFLGLAGHLKVGEIISSNPGKQYWFQVDSLTGTSLDFLSRGRIRASVVIGKTSEDGINGYLRKTGSGDVYLADVDFVRMAQRSINQWRDARLFTFDADQIKDIQWNRARDGFRLMRADSLWELSRYPYDEVTAADTQAAKAYTRTLANMRADNFPFKTQLGGVNLQAGEPLLVITLQDGGQVRLFAAESPGEENRFWVTTDKDKNVFTLYEYNFNMLNKTPEDFLPKPES